MATTVAHPTIIDVRIPDDAQANGEGAIREQIVAGLSEGVGAKSLPTVLLYDERGLRLYDRLTTDCHEYYPFAAEEQILRDHAPEIVHYMHAGVGSAPVAQETVVELGAG